jgi:hypothetical protein
MLFAEREIAGKSRLGLQADAVVQTNYSTNAPIQPARDAVISRVVEYQ